MVQINIIFLAMFLLIWNACISLFAFHAMFDKGDR